jgi:triosephosphate isomerase
MSRKPLIAANWKMHFTPDEAAGFASKLAEELKDFKEVDLMVAPAFVALPAVSEVLKNSNIAVGAQNVYFQDEGAFTGEISVPMLKNLVDYVIVGHSERRHVFHETEKDIRLKVQAVLRGGLKPVLCIGDTASERANNETLHVLRDQLASGLANVSSSEIIDVVIAYEPVWAISNGRDFTNHPVPSGNDAQKAVSTIRRQIKALFGEAAAQDLRVLYGGSTNPDNVDNYLSVEGLDGFLIGGASLNVHSFSTIIKAAQKIPLGVE